MFSPLLTIQQILAWADAHYERTGQWPGSKSGRIPESDRDTWRAVDAALSRGARGLPYACTLAQLLHRHRDARYFAALPQYTVESILAWADSHRARTGKWPHKDDGAIPDAPGQTWMMVDDALDRGARGLPGGTTLARFLVEHRDVRSWISVPDLTVDQILAWADAYHARTGAWPSSNSGAIDEAPEETWNRVEAALRKGNRGLPRGSSLAKLLAAERDKRNRKAPAPLTEAQILAWADAYHADTGEWPVSASGAVSGEKYETWKAINAALTNGGRGLTGGSSLRRLLAQHRGIRNPMQLPPLTRTQILEWADGYFARNARWPTSDSGAVDHAPEETWRAIDGALRRGARGLRGKTSLPEFLAAEGRSRGPLTYDRILAWADAHLARTGKRPTHDAGPIPESPGETWAVVAHALHRGSRGLPGGSSLSELLDRSGRTRAPLTHARIFEWADAHFRRTGKLPVTDDGPIPEEQGETWAGINYSLKRGARGLPGGETLASLLNRRTGPPCPHKWG